MNLFLVSDQLKIPTYRLVCVLQNAETGNGKKTVLITLSQKTEVDMQFVFQIRPLSFALSLDRFFV